MTNRVQTHAHMAGTDCTIALNENEEIGGITAAASVQDVKKVTTRGDTVPEKEVELIGDLGDDGVKDDTVVRNGQTAKETSIEAVAEGTSDGAVTEVKMRGGCSKGSKHRKKVERLTGDGRVGGVSGECFF